MNKPFKVGDPVRADAYGYGAVSLIHTDNRPYPVCVSFESGFNIVYTKDGKYRTCDTSQSLFHEEDHKARLATEERVILVSQDGINYDKRVVFKFKGGKAICWKNARTIEGANGETGTVAWSYWKELENEVKSEQIVELTLKDISDGKGTGVPVHLIRIKE